MKNQELIQQAIKLLADTEHDHITDLLRRFLLSNSPAVSGKFDMYNYVAKDLYRPVYTGVLHENGFRIATDGCLLIALAGQQYPEELEGCIIDKQAQKIDEKPLKWRNVIPKRESLPTCAKIDIAEIKEAAKTARQIKKEDKNFIGVYKIESNYFHIEKLLKFAIFAEYIGCNEIYLDNNRPDTAGCVWGECGSVGLIMPTMYSNALTILNK